jgi:hypothetical protein
MAALTQIRLPDGRTVRLEDWGELPLWSSQNVAVAQAQDVVFFNYGRGDTVPGGVANDLDTNMDKGGQLLGGEMFVFGYTLEPVEVEYVATVPTELTRLQLKETMRLVLAEFKVASRIYSEGKIPWFPQGSGVYGFDVANGAGIFTNGVPSPTSMRRYTVPVHIASSQEKVEARLRFPFRALSGTGTFTPWTWIWKLEGLRRRLR